MGSESRVHMGRIIFGLFIAWVGTIFILEQMGIVDLGDVWRFWPVILIVLGVAKFFRPVARGYAGGVFLIGFGVLFLLDSLDVFHLQWRYAWPAFLVFGGLSLVIRGIRWGAPGADAAAGQATLDHASHVSAFAFLGGVERKITSQDFRAADATAIMGGCILDLRGASIAPGTEAVIDTFAMWGGVDIKVPADWTVVMTGQPLLGGFVDSRREPGVETGKRLRVKGMSLMGGVEVKN